MKKISLISILIVSFLGLGMFIFSQMAIANGPLAPPYIEHWSENPKADSSLMEIQDKIYQSFVQSIMGKEASAMDKMMEELEGIYQSNEQKLTLYWMSYLQYYQSIFHLTNDNKEEAKTACLAAAKRLENMKAKNSEDYALLAMVKSFGIQFASPMKAPLTSGKVRKYAEKALAIDENNLRAFFVLASNDYYTPEQYGGMKKAEEYLLKAISLPEQAVPNPYLPSWGKEEAYEMLIKYYMRKENWEKAKATFQEASSKYPYNYPINQLAAKLVGK